MDPDEKAGLKSIVETVDSLVSEEGYLCLASVFFYRGGVKIFTQGLGSLERESVALAQALVVLSARKAEVDAARAQFHEREREHGTN